ncbi:MAG: YdcF family protein [Solobacterium sp.]|nr:YdcF family protein [Solobacterium sp.]
MLVSELTKEMLTDDIIDRVLFTLEDTGEKVDCIIVLGSKKASLYRVPVAVKAYRDHCAEKIIMCGGKVRDFPEGPMSEAQNMRNCAESLGVKSEDILTDEYSMNTVENILQALVLLQRNFGLNQVHQVLLVTVSYHMRRSLCIAEYLFPAHIRVIPCPAEDIHTRKDNWMNNPEGRDRAYTEMDKIILSVKNGLFPDFEL